MSCAGEEHAHLGFVTPEQGGNLARRIPLDILQMERFALPVGQRAHRPAHQLPRLPTSGLPVRRPLGVIPHRCVTPFIGPAFAQQVVTAVAHAGHHERLEVAARLQPLMLTPQTFQQVVHRILGLGRRIQQTPRITIHAVAERQDADGEFEFLHGICKTKQSVETQHRKIKDRHFFRNFRHPGSKSPSENVSGSPTVTPAGGVTTRRERHEGPKSEKILKKQVLCIAKYLNMSYICIVILPCPARTTDARRVHTLIL